MEGLEERPDVEERVDPLGADRDRGAVAPPHALPIAEHDPRHRLGHSRADAVHVEIGRVGMVRLGQGDLPLRRLARGHHHGGVGRHYLQAHTMAEIEPLGPRRQSQF